MKNALDEIDCIPVLGGQKPPYIVTSHPCCVDIIKAYVELSKLQLDNKEEFLCSLPLFSYQSKIE